jgi:uncharacterized protein YvpB
MKKTKENKRFKIIKKIKSVEFVEFDKNDILRSDLVRDYIIENTFEYFKGISSRGVSEVQRGKIHP